MKVIVYQGYAEEFSVRVVDGDGSTLLQYPTRFPDQADAVAKAQEYVDQFNAELEVRETIAEVAERDA